VTEQIVEHGGSMSRSVVLLLEEHLERIRRGEIDRLFRRLQLGVEERNAVDALSRSIVDGVMQTPLSMLTAASEGAGSESLATSASRLFNLRQEDR
jgi:glutamyl-tRNA reductase